MSEKKRKAVLLLQDGTVFHGTSAGKIGTTTGEIAFNTGMTGYQEIFTDPSYFNQILVMTPSHIGNYGTAEEDVESEDIKISGLVCKKFSDVFSRPIANKSLQHYFEEQDKVGICDVDTRALVRHIRNKGAMNAAISSEIYDIEKLKYFLSMTPSMEGLELASKVSTLKNYDVGDSSSPIKVAVIDFGVKRNIVRCLVDRGAYVRVFPHNIALEEIIDFAPDGVMLTNGPGDPAVMSGEIVLVNQIIEQGWPLFGICMGHQLLCLASGIGTEKMFNGHRGVNHPVKNLKTGKCEVTSQNHGFVGKLSDAEQNENIEVTHIHLNDNTLAGIRRTDVPAFSVQFHPESSAGPNDSRYLFDEFIELIKANKK